MFNFTLTNNNLPALIAKLKQLDVTQKWDVTVKPWKSKRSIDQNSRYWKLITELGAHFGYEADEMHQLMGYKFLRYEKIVGARRREFITSTTKLSTKEMADYQDKIDRFAAQHGFIFEE